MREKIKKSIHGEVSRSGAVNHGGLECLGRKYNEDNLNEIMADGDGLEYWDSSDYRSFSDTDEEGDNARQRKSRFLTFDRSSSKLKLELGMTFCGHVKAKYAITSYAVMNKKEVDIYKK